VGKQLGTNHDDKAANSLLLLLLPAGNSLLLQVIASNDSRIVVLVLWLQTMKPYGESFIGTEGNVHSLEATMYGCFQAPFCLLSFLLFAAYVVKGTRTANNNKQLQPKTIANEDNVIDRQNDDDDRDR
jgi:hypothetical protein